MDNLSLWKAVERTPVEHTKPITGKSYNGNSPKPHWLVQKATETFGPCGIGWGFTVVDERVEPGPGEERMHVARVRVWYTWDGKRGEVEHIGGTPFAGIRASGKSFMDEDAPKKSVTDALVKALSMIGFAGDIFLGRYDDSKYLAELKEEAREAARPTLTVVETAMGPSQAAQGMAKEIGMCRSQADLDAFKKMPEFQDFWRPANEADRRFVQEAATAAVARFSRERAAS